MPLPITAFYAAILAGLLFVLIINVTRNRFRAKVSINDGGDEKLSRAIRTHGNFIETVPYALGLIAIIEVNGAPAATLWWLGAVLVISRLMHSYGLLGGMKTLKIRVYGMYGTFGVILTAAGIALFQAVQFFM